MQLHIHVYGEGSATQRKVRAQRRFIAALAASVSGGYLPLTSAYEILQKAHHDAK
jgi:hypothetical protein